MLSPLLRETETQSCRKRDTAKTVVAQRGYKEPWRGGRQRKNLFLLRKQAGGSHPQDEGPKIALGHSDFLLCQTQPRTFCEGMLDSPRANEVPVDPQRSATLCFEMLPD